MARAARRETAGRVRPKRSLPAKTPNAHEDWPQGSSSDAPSRCHAYNNSRAVSDCHCVPAATAKKSSLLASIDAEVEASWEDNPLLNETADAKWHESDADSDDSSASEPSLQLSGFLNGLSRRNGTADANWHDMFDEADEADEADDTSANGLGEPRANATNALGKSRANASGVAHVGSVDLGEPRANTSGAADEDKIVGDKESRAGDVPGHPEVHDGVLPATMPFRLRREGEDEKHEEIGGSLGVRGGAVASGLAAFYYAWYRTPEHDGGWQHWNHKVAGDLQQSFCHALLRNVD
jgi:hypothetical protein